MEKEYIKEYKYVKAKEKVEKIKRFYIHAIITVLILPFLIFLNLRYSPQYHWFWFPVLGMIVGLVFHWLSIYGGNFFLGKDWEERKIKEFMNNDKL